MRIDLSGYNQYQLNDLLMLKGFFKKEDASTPVPEDKLSGPYRPVAQEQQHVKEDFSRLLSDTSSSTHAVGYRTGPLAGCVYTQTHGDTEPTLERREIICKSAAIFESSHTVVMPAQTPTLLSRKQS
ncbi:hypothetical protein ACOMHN_042347 [Nucella lapillus]